MPVPLARRRDDGVTRMHLEDRLAPRLRSVPSRGPNAHDALDRRIFTAASDCATMSHMERVGIRELRRQASGLVRRAAAGAVIEVTDRGRAVAVLVPAMPTGLARLDREGLLRPAEGNLLDLDPVALPPGAVAPSRLVEAGRAE